MTLNDLLSQEKDTILKEWFDVAARSYPAETYHVLIAQKNPFANPIGAVLSKGLQDVFDALIDHSENEKLKERLDPLIRVRAVQNFTPSQAIGFLFSLKTVIRHHLGKKIKKAGMDEALPTIESRIDQAALIAFDIYMACKETIYSIKAEEIKNQAVNVLEKAGLIG